MALHSITDLQTLVGGISILIMIGMAVTKKYEPKRLRAPTTDNIDYVVQIQPYSQSLRRVRSEILNV